MAATMLTPTEISTPSRPSGPLAVLAVPGQVRWRRAATQALRQNLIPWLAVKGTLTALVVTGLMGFWVAFVVDSVVSLAVVGYGWWLTRR